MIKEIGINVLTTGKEEEKAIKVPNNIKKSLLKNVYIGNFFECTYHNGRIIFNAIELIGLTSNAKFNKSSLFLSGVSTSFFMKIVSLVWAVDDTNRRRQTTFQKPLFGLS